MAWAGTVRRAATGSIEQTPLPRVFGAISCDGGAPKSRPLIAHRGLDFSPFHLELRASPTPKPHTHSMRAIKLPRTVPKNVGLGRDPAEFIA